MTNEKEIREYAKARGWKWIAQNGLLFGGYWKDKEGNCYYAKAQKQEQMPLKLEKAKGAQTK